MTEDVEKAVFDVPMTVLASMYRQLEDNIDMKVRRYPQAVVVGRVFTGINRPLKRAAAALVQAGKL